MTGTLNPSTRELPLGHDGTVDVVLASAGLRVRGVDGDRVVVRSRDGDPLGDEIQVDATPDTVRVRDGLVAVRIGPVSFRTGRSRDLDIDVPRTARVTVRTASGDVEAVGIAGPSHWASASGDLRIAVEGGAVQLETVSGDAILEAAGSIDVGARTLSGDLRVRAPRLATTDLGTTSGDIRLEAELAAGGRHAITSVSGDVDLVTGSPVRMEVDTIAGDVRAQGEHRVEGARGHRTLVTGAGSVAVSVRTTSGDVRLQVVGAQGGAVVAEPVVAEPVAPASPAAVEEPGTAPEAAQPAAAAGMAAVAEAVAGPVLPRPVDEDDTQAWTGLGAQPDPRAAARLDLLRALERGELDVETASRRLEDLEAGESRGLRESM